MSRRIAVIEDDATIQANLLELLSAEGYDARGASNGVAGLALLKGWAPELVICDITMPELDGYGVLEAVRAEPELSAIPFVFLSARADRSDVRTGMALGADDYITK